MRHENGVLGHFPMRVSSSATTRFVPLRGLGDDSSSDDGQNDSSNCMIAGTSKKDLEAYKECEKSYWGATAGDCHTWSQMAEHRGKVNDDICRATGRTTSDNPCLELANSCLSTVVCQVFNYLYAEGQFTKECGKYGPEVAKLFWPTWNLAINFVQGKIPCDLQINADRMHASSAVVPYWSRAGFYDRYERAILIIQKTWGIARSRAGLPQSDVCIEPSTLGIQTDLTQIDGPQSTDPGSLLMAQCGRGTSEYDTKYKKFCACGKGYNAEHALLAYASRSGAQPLTQGGCIAGDIDGSVQVCSDGVDYANIQRPADTNFGERGYYPFSLYWTGRATFKTCDSHWWDVVQNHIAEKTGVRLAAMEEAILPVMAACFAQAEKDKKAALQNSLIPGVPYIPPPSSSSTLRVVPKNNWSVVPAKTPPVKTPTLPPLKIPPIFKNKSAANYALIGTAILLAVVGALVVRKAGKRRAKPNRRRIRHH